MTLNDLSYSVGETTLLRNINAIVSEQDRVGVIGENGAGKTTLLRLITGPIEGTPAKVESMTLFWSLYNVIMLAVAALMCVEAPRYRKEERFATDEAASALIGGR